MCEHGDGLLKMFIDECAKCGGPTLDLEELKLQASNHFLALFPPLRLSTDGIVLFKPYSTVQQHKSVQKLKLCHLSHSD